MRIALVTTLVAVGALACSACSSPTTPSAAIVGLATTGQNTTGNSDNAWQLTCSPNASSGTPCPVLLQQAQRVTNGFAEWLPPPPGTWWVGTGPTGTLPAGVGDNVERYVYSYRLTFQVNGNPSTAMVTLTWACDNYFHGWRLNGGDFKDVQSENVRWQTLKTLTISNANATFARGGNTLEFRIVGDGQTDGFLIGSIVGSVQ